MGAQVDPREAARGAAQAVGLLALVLIALALLVAYARAEVCDASYYGYGRAACRGMAVGPMTAAHRTLPCGTRVRVTTARGSVTLTVTDRGPYVRGRCIDVSADAARPLGLVGPGHLRATVEVVGH